MSGEKGMKKKAQLENQISRLKKTEYVLRLIAYYTRMERFLEVSKISLDEEEDYMPKIVVRK